MLLDELYTTSNMPLLKQAMPELDTIELNKDIPQEDKRFAKCDGKLCNITKFNS